MKLTTTDKKKMKNSRHFKLIVILIADYKLIHAYIEVVVDMKVLPEIKN